LVFLWPRLGFIYFHLYSGLYFEGESLETMETDFVSD